MDWRELIGGKERTGFKEDGIIRLAKRLPKSRVDPARDYIVSELTRLRLRDGGKWLTKPFNGIPPFQVAGMIARKIKPHAALDDVIPDDLVVSLEQLAGCKLQAAQVHPHVLVTPPQKESWSIPETGWHVDIAKASGEVVAGVQIFVLLDDLASKGGATMAIRGSHRVRDLQPTPDQIVEMCGKAGDVYLMNMSVVHAPSINASKKARMMLTARYLNLEVSSRWRTIRTWGPVPGDSNTSLRTSKPSFS